LNLLLKSTESGSRLFRSRIQVSTEQFEKRKEQFSDLSRHRPRELTSLMREAKATEFLNRSWIFR
jgi:hypothetical protein